MKRATVALAFVVASMAQVVLADETEVNFVYMPAPDAETLVIESPMGSLRVNGWDKPQVRITSKKHAMDAATLERLRIQVEMQGGQIRIRSGVYVRGVFKPLPPAAGEGAGIELSVDAPRSARLVARTWSGDVEASGFRAGAELTSTGGEVRARDIAGPVHTNADFGRQRLASIHGSVDAHTLKGDMDLESVEGDLVDARVAEGQITGRDLHAAMVRLFTTAGGIVLIGTLQPGARYELSALDGDIQLRLRPQPFTVTAHTPTLTSSMALRTVSRTPNEIRAEHQGGGAMLDLAAARQVVLDPY
jgi:DUF4097 and DUF4098 domain-containing protein YvlB